MASSANLLAVDTEVVERLSAPAENELQNVVNSSRERSSGTENHTRPPNFRRSPGLTKGTTKGKTKYDDKLKITARTLILYFHCDVIAFDHNFVTWNALLRWWPQNSAGFQVEIRTVPRTGSCQALLMMMMRGASPVGISRSLHGQEIGRRRHLRTHLLREFQLRRREKVLYTYDFLDLREWEMRVLDIEPGSAEAWRPRCLAGCAATPSMRLQRTAPARQLRKTRCIFCSRLSVAFARKRERIFVQREEDHIRTY